MKRHLLTALLMYPLMANAAGSYYCSQNGAYIDLGMTESQVLAACGQPTTRQTTKTTTNPVFQQIPVTQLIYTTLNPGALFYYPGIEPLYQMWSLPSGAQGISMQFDLINNQVTSIKLNGSSTNALSACQGGAVQIGDSIAKVYNACGSPTTVNNTYINRPIPASQNPQVWIYIINQYQPSITLTFTNGILQSIN